MNYLLAVERKGKIISAENVTGTRDYIPRLFEICKIIVSHGDPENCKIVVSTTKKRTEIDGDSIKKLGASNG